MQLVYDHVKEDIDKQHEKIVAELGDGYSRKVAELNADSENRILQLIANKDAEKENSMR